MGVLVSYAQPEDMTISVDVVQEDVVVLAVGDPVEIAFTAYEGETYSGTILSIDTTATAAGSNTVSYSVVIGVEGDTTPLYGGMVADVTFVTEQKEDVLYVSRQAIVTENGKDYVYRKTSSGGKQLTEVETGSSNGVSVEILSGLSEGDTIYIASRVSSTSEVRDSGTQSSGNEEGAGDEMQMPGEGQDSMQMPGGGQDNMQMPGGGGGNMQMPGGNGGQSGGMGGGQNRN
jgi:HlyD family secretion protein